MPEQNQTESKQGKEKGWTVSSENNQAGPFASGYVKNVTNVYEKAITKLNQFFEPKQNISFERHIFRQLKQKENERIDMFMMRLREQAERCDFGQQLDENIRDQITSGCLSDILRRKILERGNEQLENIIKIARILEIVTKQQKSFGKSDVNQPDTHNRTNESDVCKIEAKSRFPMRQKAIATGFNGECGRCGLKGHKAVDEKCPAKGKTCNSCGRKDHFSRKCFLRGNPAQKNNFNKRKTETRNDEDPQNKIKRESVRLVATEAKDSTESIIDDYDDVFAIDSGIADDNKIWCKIGDIECEVIVDSGTRYNIIDRLSWIKLKAKNVNIMHRQREVDINFRSYGGQPLKFLGMVKTIVSTPQKQVEANFYIADEFGKVLLGYETGKALGVLIIGTGTAPLCTQVNAVDAIKPLGKIKGVMVDISIKEDAKGVVQPYRRVPAPLEKRVDDKIEEMVRQDIIEKVNGVAKFISPLVIAPKDDDDIRICVDMRRANLAVEREIHPLPTMDDFLPQLDEAKVFSKLDVKQACHQVDEN